jgi:hypothetical protein
MMLPAKNRRKLREAQRELRKELAGILWGTEQQRGDFERHMVDALKAYWRVLAAMPRVPANRRPRDSLDRFVKLGAAARRFSAEVGQLDERERLWLGSLIGRSALEWLHNAPAMATCIHSAAAEAAERHRILQTRKRTPVEAILFNDLRTAYEFAFQKPASSNEDGIFFRAYQAIIAKAGIPETIHRKKAEELIGG